MKSKGGFRFHIPHESLPVIIFFGVIAIVAAIFSILSPYFLTTSNLFTALKHLSTTSLAALGLTYVVAVGHSDMSFHFISCLAAMTMSYGIALGWHPLPAILIGLAPALVFGWINGMAVGRFKLPDMIVTIAVGSAAWGMAYLYSDGEYIYRNFLTSGIISLSDGRLFGVSYPVYYLFVAYLLSYIFLHRTKYGRNFYAVGSNKTAARFSGVKVERYIIIAFLLCAGLASFTNLVLVAAQSHGNVKGGLMLLMPAWAAVFVGISIFKKPSVIGTFFGAFLISMMQNGFTLMSSPFYIMDLLVGLTLVGALLISRVQLRKKAQDESYTTVGLVEAK